MANMTPDQYQAAAEANLTKATQVIGSQTYQTQEATAFAQIAAVYADLFRITKV